MDEDPQVDSALRWTLHGHSEALNCLVFSDDGKFLASGGKCMVWQLVGPHRLLTTELQLTMVTFVSGHSGMVARFKG